MRKLALVIGAVCAVFVLDAGAANRTISLEVADMTCPVCPITVKKALQKVAGVSDAQVSYEKKEALVTFDDAKTNVDALRKATADAGYPSRLKK